MSPSTFKQGVDNTSGRSSFSTTRSGFSETSSLSKQHFFASQSTLVSSPSSSKVSCLSQPTLLSEASPSDANTGDLTQNEDARARRYTRRVVRDIPRRTTIRIASSRMRVVSTVSSPGSPTSPRSPSSLSSSPASAAPAKAALPMIRRYLSGQIHPDQLAQRHPNNIYTYGPPRGPDPSKLPHPIPDIIITDYSLLLSAASRYASSPRCLGRVQPYHNVVDLRFLGRYSASVGVIAPGCRPIEHEIMDVETFAELGGQGSVLVLGPKRLVQRRVVAKGCPSCACLCKGRGVAMSRCWDLMEDEEQEVATSSGWSCGIRRMPVRDRIDEARRMRVRIEQRREVRQVSPEERKKESNTIQQEREVEVKQELGRIKTVRRRRSKFIEVGCKPGNDLVGASCPAVRASANDREVVVKNSGAGSGGGQSQRGPRSNVTKRPLKFWIKRLLHV